METASINGTTIAYEVHGQGEPLLLIHGAGISRQEWQPQIEPLGRSFRLIIPDVRGHGDSGQTPAPYSMALFAEDMMGLLDHLKISQVLICGHSMGGAIAQQMAANHPERVKKLILAETNYGFEDSLFLKLATVASLPLMKLMGISRLKDMTIRQLGIKDPAIQQVFDSAFMPQIQNPTNFWNIWDANTAFKGKEQLRRIQCPTLVMIAQNNRATHKMGHYMAEAIPNAKLMTIPDAGHGLNWDNAAAFNTAVTEFFLKETHHATT